MAQRDSVYSIYTNMMIDHDTNLMIDHVVKSAI